MSHLFEIAIGDDSGDGHGRCEYFTVESNKPLSAVQKAYNKAQKQHPALNPTEFVCDYEDSRVPAEVVEAMDIAGLNKEDFLYEAYDSRGEYTTDPHQMADFVVAFIKLGDPELELKIAENPNRLKLGGQVGYGLFY